MFTLAPPLPPQSGGSRYAVNTTAALRDDYEFHLFTIGGEAERAHIASNRALYDAMFASVHVEPRAPMPAQKSLVGKAFHVLDHWRHALPFCDASYYSPQAVRNARRIVREQTIDILEIHTAHLAFFKAFMPHIPSLLVNHNIEGDLFPFWMPQGLPPWKSATVSALAQISRRNARAVEIENAFGFEAMTSISSEVDQRITATVDKVHIPLCIPLETEAKAVPTEPKSAVDALWLGGFWWYPNADAVDHFIADILPILSPRLAEENIILHFVGANPPEALRALAGPNIRVHGFVDDLDGLLAGMDMLFVPMRLGSGVRVKILEAMAHGIPVVSTSKGCEGLDARHGHELLIADTPRDFADCMIDLARHGEKRRHLARNATDMLKRDYDLGTHASVMAGIYQRLMHAHRRRGVNSPLHVSPKIAKATDL